MCICLPGVRLTGHQVEFLCLLQSRRRKDERSWVSIRLLLISGHENITLPAFGSDAATDQLRYAT